MTRATGHSKVDGIVIPQTGRDFVTGSEPGKPKYGVPPLGSRAYANAMTVKNFDKLDPRQRLSG